MAARKRPAPVAVNDSLVNLTAQIGTERDKASSSFYAPPLMSDQEIMSAYRGSWLPRKIVDIPALDATRKWRSWQAESDLITKLEAEEKRLNLRAKVREALIVARLRGGSAIYIGTGDSDPSKPFDPTRVVKGGIQFLNVMSRTQLTEGEIQRNPALPGYGKPIDYTIASTAGASVPIHPSRLVLFYGATVPDSLADETATITTTKGWGDSVLLAVRKAMLDADSTLANVASLVFEASVDVISIENFMSSLADPKYAGQVLNRLQLAATAKGINGTLLLDAAEKYERKGAEFGTLPDVIDRFLQVVSGAADIPATRLLGQAPAGMNATGDSDTRNYYDRIQSMQELDVGPAMELLDEALIRSALGARPPEVFYLWQTLWQPTAEQRSAIGKQAAETINTIKQSGLFATEPLSRAAQNMLTELGVMPGLESAMAEWEAEGNERQDDEPEAPLPGEVDPVTGRPALRVVGDSAPAPLYVQRKVVNTGAILAWAKSQGFTEPTAADDLHVTIAYSTQPVDWMKAGMGDGWGSDEMGNLRVAPGGARVVEPLGDGGAVVLMFNSSALAYRNEQIREAGASWDYDGYQPHITLTYNPSTLDLSKVEPYRGEIILGPEMFEPLNTGWAASRKG